MPERLPEVPEWQRREQAVAAAREAIGEGLAFGTVAVEYDSPAWDTGQVWVRASCDDCGATRVMRASDQTHLRYLAMSVARNDCPDRGHENNSLDKEPNDEPLF